MDTDTYGKIKTYVNHNPVAILGTIGSDGFPHGAVIYIYADDTQPVVYFTTKQATKKYQNLTDHSHVSLTVVNSSENSTLQASGHSFEVQDSATIDMVMKKIAHNHPATKEWLPPIAKLHAGAYVVVGIELVHARLSQFQGMAIGDEHIFARP